MSASNTDQNSSFTLSSFNGHELAPSVRILLPENLTADELSRLLDNPAKPAYGFPALRDWLSKLLQNFKLQDDASHPYHKNPYRLHEITIQAVDWFWRNRPGQEDKLGFMKVQSKIITDPYLHDGEDKPRADWVPGAVFLRGGSVSMLVILQPEDAKDESERYVVFTVQPRIAAGSLAFTEIPAGMLDGNTFKGSAANELKEEAHLTVKEDDLINMSELAIQDDNLNSEEQLQAAVYPSVGACDEFIPSFLCCKRLTRRHIEWLKGKATGLRNEGESITLKLVPLEQAWKEGARDAKALSALALYAGLVNEGKISSQAGTTVEEEPEELRMNSSSNSASPSAKKQRHP